MPFLSFGRNGDVQSAKGKEYANPADLLQQTRRVCGNDRPRQQPPPSYYG